MRTSLVARLACLAFLAMVTVAAAAPITYDVNRTIGPGSVVGTIQTTGALGVLGTSDITAFSLTISEGDANGPFLLTNANSAVLVSGSLLTATAADLFFNFSGNNGFLLFQNPNTGSGQNWWCVEGVNSFCAASGSSTESVNRFGTETFVSRQGQVSIASAQAAAVPEPATLTLLGLGLAAARLRRSRRRQ